MIERSQQAIIVSKDEDWYKTTTKYATFIDTFDNSKNKERILLRLLQGEVKSKQYYFSLFRRG